ncbi:hypothetical protein TRFO_06885 [Tritrichomonas foetus]|uniref:Uncharacterized protein n=1 Tax=Tritrichomonas foetus TaxID=1144522 RepID=A0A1J4K018_9EUKA|nr:hypothetical protein TRFO_06885 [Tritrichomonas foetus]|eukprot:OHT02853.1 hypothetical protein TRFO_06885 [Tritrichomonas foetus]
MTYLQLSDACGLQRFALLNMPNDFRFVIDSHNYYMPKILADYLSPAVSELHYADPTVTFFVISNVNDDNFYFELFMKLVCGLEIEINLSNCFFIQVVASRLMNEEILLAASEYSNKHSPINNENVTSKLSQKKLIGIYPKLELDYISCNFWSINPKNLFMIDLDDLKIILSHPNLKIISEEWLLRFISKLIKEKGREYCCLLSYISFNDLEIKTLQDFINDTELYNNSDLQGPILRTIQNRLSNNEIPNNKILIDKCSHFYATRDERRQMFVQSRSKNHDFNKEYFNENPIMDNFDSDFFDIPFDNPSPYKHNYDDPFYKNLGIGINPLKPNHKKIFPDYFSRIQNIPINIGKNNDNDKKYDIENENNRNDDDNENQGTQINRKRISLINSDQVLSFSKPIGFKYDYKSETIPINFHLDNFRGNNYESSSDSDNDLFSRVAEETFSEIQQQYDASFYRDDNDNHKNNNKQNNASHSTTFRCHDGLLIPPEMINNDNFAESFYQNNNDNDDVYEKCENFADNLHDVPPEPILSDGLEESFYQNNKEESHENDKKESKFVFKEIFQEIENDDDNIHQFEPQLTIFQNNEIKAEKFKKSDSDDVLDVYDDVTDDQI